MTMVPSTYALLPPPLVSPLSRLSYGGDAVAFAGGVTGASTTWTSANLAYYFPFRMEYPDTARKMWVENGTVVAGNVDVAIYDASGARLVSMGSTAQAGTSAVQVFDITDTYLAAGRYYMGLALSSATATVIRAAPNLEMERCLGVQQQATAFPLPSTVTFAAVTTAYVPFFGIAFRTTPVG